MTFSRRPGHRFNRGRIATAAAVAAVVGPSPTLVPTLSVQMASADTDWAPDLVAVTARAVTSDADGYTTTGVNIYESGVLVGAATNAGSGVWTYALGALATGSKSYTARRLTAGGNLDSAAWPLSVVNPGTLATTWGVTLAQWLRADTTVNSGGLISQITDKSGNGRHETSSGTRQPTLATDAAFGGQAIVRFLGESEISANRDQATVPGWARAAPGTSPYWLSMVLRAFGPTLGSNRMIVSDSVLNVYQIIRPNVGTPDLQMKNSASVANTNTNLTDNTVKRLEAYFSNSLSTDYLLIGNTVGNGTNAGNLGPGANEQMAVNQAASSWGWYDFAEKIAITGGVPPAGFLSALDAYYAATYGVAA